MLDLHELLCDNCTRHSLCTAICTAEGCILDFQLQLNSMQANSIAPSYRLLDMTSDDEMDKFNQVIIGMKEIYKRDYKDYHSHETKLVCLCGSSKFKDEYEDAYNEEIANNNIPLTLSKFSKADNEPLNEDEKRLLREHHNRKIQRADEVLIICPNGYIGASTEYEIAYAKSLNKPIRFRQTQRGEK